VTLTAPTTFVLKTTRIASRSSGVRWEPIPALFTRISRWPYVSFTCCAAESTEASEVTSIWIAVTVPLMGNALRAATASSPFEMSRLPSRTWYVAEDRRRFLAASKPMP